MRRLKQKIKKRHQHHVRSGLILHLAPIEVDQNRVVVRENVSIRLEEVLGDVVERCGSESDRISRAVAIHPIRGPT